MTLPTPGTEPVTTAHQNASIPPITLERVDLSSLTTKPVADLVASLSGTRLGVCALYGKKCALAALAFSSESRVLLITMRTASKPTKFQMGILRDELLCNTSLEKHSFFVEHLAAALFLDFGLYIRQAFDLVPSAAAYKAALKRARAQNSLDGSVVKFILTDQATILPRKTKLALRAWASYVAVQGAPRNPGLIDTSIKDAKARST